MGDQVKGAFTVRFLKIGDDVYITREIYRIENGVRYGAALFQAVDPTSGALSVDWTIEKYQPIVEFRAVSAVGYPANLIEALFVYDGEAVSFSSADATGWKTSIDGRFKLKLEDGKVFFKIVKNIASKTQIANKQISYSLSYISNGMINSYVGSMDVIIQQAGSSSHYAVIVTPRIVLDSQNPSTTLTLQATYGVKNITIGQDGYTAEWYKDKEKLPNTGSSIEVNRDDINGASMYVAKLLLDGVIVAQDGQYISDVADEYQVRVYRFVDYVNEKTNGQFEFYLMKNNVKLETENSAWTWDIYNALGVITKSGSGKEMIITKDDCKNQPIGGGKEYYSDADYVGTVTII
jgi:hypothetical protein